MHLAYFCADTGRPSTRSLQTNGDCIHAKALATDLRVALPSSMRPCFMSSNSLRDSAVGRSLQGLGLLSSLHAATCSPRSLAGSCLPKGRVGRQGALWRPLSYHAGALNFKGVGMPRR